MPDLLLNRDDVLLPVQLRPPDQRHHPGHESDHEQACAGVAPAALGGGDACGAAPVAWGVGAANEGEAGAANEGEAGATVAWGAGAPVAWGVGAANAWDAAATGE